MGTFRQIQHPRTDRLIQIKTGDDWFQVQKIGDKVDWEASPHNVGYHPDNVYDDELFYNEPDPAYVVVKDLTIVDVVDFIPPPTKDEDEIAEVKWAQKKTLLDKWQIGDPSPDLWKPEWWEVKKAREEKYQKEYAEETEKYRAAGYDVDSLGFQLARPIIRNLDYSGVARRALQTSPVVGDRDPEPVQDLKPSQELIDKIKAMAKLMAK